MKEIITDKSTIEKVLNGRCVYVDKTAYLNMSDAVEDPVVAEIDSEN